MENDLNDLRRAYELLKQVYENDYILKPHLKAEIEELMTPEWIKDIDK